MESHFSNLEKEDGYFSGTMHVKARNGDLFTVEFGYDVDTRKLDLWACRALLHGTDTEQFKPHAVADFRERFGGMIFDEIYGELIWRYGPQQSFAEYEAQAYEEPYGD